MIYRPMVTADLPLVADSWIEGHKNSPTTRRLQWAAYKQLVVPDIRAALARSDTQVTVAEDATDGMVGWLAAARWPSIDVVHWIWVMLRHRGKGVARGLFERHGLRSRVAYTHKAAIRRGETRADVRIADRMRQDGKIVSYVPYKEWSR